MIKQNTRNWLLGLGVLAVIIIFVIPNLNLPYQANHPVFNPNIQVTQDIAGPTLFDVKVMVTKVTPNGQADMVLFCNAYNQNRNSLPAIADANGNLTFTWQQVPSSMTCTVVAIDHKTGLSTSALQVVTPTVGSSTTTIFPNAPIMSLTPATINYSTVLNTRQIHVTGTGFGTSAPVKFYVTGTGGSPYFNATRLYTYNTTSDVFGNINFNVPLYIGPTSQINFVGGNGAPYQPLCGQLIYANACFMQNGVNFCTYSAAGKLTFICS